MPKSGVEIPSEYFFPENEMDGQNKTWLGEFKTSKKKPYADGYISKLSKFLRFRDFANVPLNTFRSEDVSIYLTILQKYKYPAKSGEIAHINRSISHRVEREKTGQCYCTSGVRHGPVTA